MRYLLWSNKHQMWWRPNRMGYTPELADAGRYSEEEAVRRVVASAWSGDLGKVTCMVAEPAPGTGTTLGQALLRGEYSAEPDPPTSRPYINPGDDSVNDPWATP